MKYKAAAAVSIARRFLSAGDAVLEIGAADGEYTRIYADRVGRTGRVLAVEPYQPHVRELRRLSVTLPWVTVRHAAVGAVIGDALFYPDQTDPKRSSLWSTNVPDPGEASMVPMTTVDALVAWLPSTPALIHVDAQGAEAGILAGARQTLTLPIVWIVELWSSGLQHAGSSVAEVMDAFQAHAYAPRSVRGARLDWAAAVDQASSRRGLAHADVVMVPETLTGVSW